MSWSQRPSLVTGLGISRYKMSFAEQPLSVTIATASSDAAVIRRALRGKCRPTKETSLFDPSVAANTTTDSTAAEGQVGTLSRLLF